MAATDEWDEFATWWMTHKKNVRAWIDTAAADVDKDDDDENANDPFYLASYIWTQAVRTMRKRRTDEDK